MHCPSGTGFYEDGGMMPHTVPGPGGEDLGFVGFAKEFKYMGSIVHLSLTSDADVDQRIRSAAAAYGALSSVVCNFALEGGLRGKI